MPQQLKKIAFLVPRAGLSRDGFTQYWRGTHGPLVAESPGYAAYRHKYVQNHFVEITPIGEPFDYSGMAVFWLPGDNEDTYATTSIYRDRIRVDELKFIDMDGTISMTVVEEVALAGKGAVKLVVVKKEGSLSSLGSVAKIDGLSGAVINHLLKGSFRLPGARPISGAIATVEELWFASQAMARRAIDGFTANAGWSAFFAKEYVFFENGAPVPQIYPN
jgi:uncharacterized protein (TIGR02118 family)